MNAISLKDVWLKYRIEFKENGRFIPEDFWALRGIDIDVGEGEAIGIIGENGAGKTTLLKVIAGMLKPDKGVVQVNGKMSAIMEIGAGFQKDLTGRENIYLISSFFGLTKEQIDARYNDMVKFASIGRFINAPVKSYSQGMYMRLAFAIAIHVEPDILLVDEIFTVGDLYAQNKCINKMFELKAKGKTVMFVTHDVEIAKRFCRRGISLKDGKVIKDGSLKEVVSYYLKTVGDKKGIGILQGARLGLVFNNGKLILNWDNDSMTKKRGGHTYVFSNDNHYSSLEADWELKESSRDRIVLEGRFWDLPISQSWDIELDDVKNEIDLKIEMDIKENFNLQECGASFMFEEGYKYWFNPFYKKLFEVSDLSEELSWRPINSETPAVDFVGLGALDNADASLPSVILEDNVYMRGKLLEVKDTDRTFKARVLQSKIPYYGTGLCIETGRRLLFHIRIKVIETLSIEDSFRKNLPRTMVPKIINGPRNLSLTADDKNIVSLYWKDKKMTPSKGFKTKFCHNGKTYHSSDAIWTIHKASDSRLDISIQWIGLPVRQIWNIQILEDGVLQWKVYLNALERVVVRNNKFSIMFLPQYTEWITSSEEGEISEEINTKNFKNIIMRNDPYGIIGLNGSLSDNLELPCVLLYDTSPCIKFNSLEKKLDRNTDVLDARVDVEPIVTLYFLSLDSKESITCPRGSYLICDTRILIGDDLQQKKHIEYIRENRKQTLHYSKREAICSSEAVIENGQYKFHFIKGKGRLFFKDIEITKNFGIYTSLYSSELDKEGLWHISLDAIWEILSFKRKRLVVRGRWPFLPITQIWEIKASGNGFIWKVDMEVFASMLIERQLSYLMLSDKYRDWGAAGGRAGFFPEEFSLLRWEDIYRQRGCDRLCAGTRDNNAVSAQPGVNFLCAQEVSNFEAIIENSNTTFSSRILGFEKIICRGNHMFRPGLYKYFHGEISKAVKIGRHKSAALDHRLERLS